MSELGKTLIEDVKKRLVGAYPAQVRAALETLSDEQLWWRPNPGANSVGNLVLHLVGSTRHFLGRGVGTSDYVRDRPAEFSESGSRSREELEGLLTETVEETRQILDALDPGGLLEVSERTGEPHTILALLLRVAHHWSVHAGQILYAAKALREGAFDEVWIRSMK
jgi:uncharacterized damage-inducible protein DinB